MTMLTNHAHGSDQEASFNRKDPRRGSPLIRYAGIITAVAVLCFTGVLILLGYERQAQVTASLFALGAAVLQMKSVIDSWRQHHLGVDLLATIAILSTVAVGEYFASLIIVIMLTGGRALERMAEGRATNALRNLLQHAPQTAHVVGPGTGEKLRTDIPAETVEPGQMLLVRPGELVPVDGLLQSSTGELDESALTGESLPAERHPGDIILAGSVNGGTSLYMIATATTENSQYSKIISLVEEASRSRAQVVRLADRYALPFTAISLLAAAAAWWMSGEPVRFAEVLVVATPCPLLIGAPVAFIGGMGRCASAGIVVKTGKALEALAGAQTIVFDKTGTLTTGRPQLLRLRLSKRFEGKLDKNEVLRWAASAEQGSSHVVANSVIEAARTRGLDLDQLVTAREQGTEGVVADLTGTSVAVGKRKLITTETRSEVPEEALRPGETAAYIAINGEYAGAMILADALRAEAPATLEQLAELGVTDTVVLSGDTRNVVNLIAGECGIPHAEGDCLPEDKVRIVRELPRRPVAMVGDGINDAPVLAAANVGIAMGARGATAASESADVVIMMDDLSRVPLAIRIARRTRRIALTSIWVGIGASLLLMGIAFAGLLPAVGGALAQELVDLLAIGVAIRAALPVSERA